MPAIFRKTFCASPPALRSRFAAQRLKLDSRSGVAACVPHPPIRGLSWEVRCSQTSLVDRRRFLFKAAPTAVAAAAVSAWPHLASGTDVLRAYTPTFFSAADWAFIIAAVDRLIPSGCEDPGGMETGVLDFVGRQMELPYGHGSYWYLKRPFADCAPETLGYQLPYAPGDLYRNVIREVNAGCSKTSETLQRLDLSRI